MARPRRVSDEQLVQVARACFLERGPSVGLKEIGARLGVSHAAVLHRVGSKERLLAMALEVAPPREIEGLLAGPSAEEPAEEALVALLDALLGYFRALVPGLVVGRASGVSTSHLPAGAGPKRARRDLAAWLGRATALRLVDTPDPDASAEALVGPLESRAFAEHLAGASRPRPATDRVWLTRLVRAVARPITPRGRKP